MELWEWVAGWEPWQWTTGGLVIVAAVVAVATIVYTIAGELRQWRRRRSRGRDSVSAR